MVNEELSDSGILHQKNWHTSVAFFLKEVVEVMEDLLQSMLLLKTRNLFD